MKSIAGLIKRYAIQPHTILERHLSIFFSVFFFGCFLGLDLIALRNKHKRNARDARKRNTTQHDACCINTHHIHNNYIMQNMYSLHMRYAATVLSERNSTQRKACPQDASITTHYMDNATINTKFTTLQRKTSHTCESNATIALGQRMRLWECHCSLWVFSSFSPHFSANHHVHAPIGGTAGLHLLCCECTSEFVFWHLLIFGW